MGKSFFPDSAGTKPSIMVTQPSAVYPHAHGQGDRILHPRRDPRVWWAPSCVRRPYRQTANRSVPSETLTCGDNLTPVLTEESGRRHARNRDSIPIPIPIPADGCARLVGHGPFIKAVRAALSRPTRAILRVFVALCEKDEHHTKPQRGAKRLPFATPSWGGR